ncbi:bifunctional diaminohydroxyphosphoribosylaminopyrimidine deaminase/5-amino-6-(5-phosphoribosylamino)uracil reductase RibD [Sulfuriferula nivalis]|uniref:Riboflavin biosynthesis protein RibD n=1 Tax=Sulfuriferula nivalis TaxID=2675298 RepID=A0A809S3W0_9PROT|nr:bifunctional diaminohydroxyphosphoribosylaminopyrimidine deaminase/5-amino-6-(5-phosphoribosylamino)uracil reductase RibD [Sulfuriferula nivalis]BBP01528.1 riboflavin biosynthesis protein RibD [Sulfuriferula nivalis]
MWTSADYSYMAHALQLAERGLNTTSPNPRVGCVIVNHGRIVGEGWHQRAGEAHAEVHALLAAGEHARGATAYVTLEPCSHFGRTPPCADALIHAGVSRVIAAMQDPNPQVAGNGLARLQAAGIATSSGLLEAQAQQLNRGFIQRMTLKRPWITLKTAASLDGKTALSSGESKWITGGPARLDVHRLRARSCAILTGIGTVLADDPSLNVRDIATTRQPLKIIVDSQLRTPLHATILKQPGTIIAHNCTDMSRQTALIATGAELIHVVDETPQINLPALMVFLAQRGINEIMTEAGAILNAALIQADLVDEWVMYVAPTLLGNDARGLFALPQPDNMAARRKLNLTDTRLIGTDLRITAQFTRD